MTFGHQFMTTHIRQKRYKIQPNSLTRNLETILQVSPEIE
jgi:hypothetical protein